MIKTAQCLTVSFLLTILLTGCQSPKRALSTTDTPNAEATANHDKKQAEAERMQQCLRELDAMRTLNPQEYQRFKREFDTLMSGAAQYAGVRSQVNGDTQETVDALYRYRTHRTCADIRTTMMTGLAERGERTQ